MFSSSEAREENLGNTKNARLIREYRAKVEQELNQICSSMISLLDEWLIPKADSQACSVFYWKMKGDYLRYMAEFVDEAQRAEVVTQSEAAYEKATELAASLPPTNIVRLGLALNYSVFFYEIKGEPEKECKISRET
jgi:14-3-3 protein epsilon